MGWAVLLGGNVKALGCIRTEKATRKGAVRVADDDAARCQAIARCLANVVRLNGVGGIVCEMPSGGAQGARAIACMARASAVVAVTVELLGLPAEWYTPGDVKRIVGAGVVTKEQVEAVVRRRWPRLTLPKLAAEREHCSDALGCYLAAEHGNLVRMLNQ